MKTNYVIALVLFSIFSIVLWSIPVMAMIYK